MNVGQRIKQRRKELGYNADFLAKHLNVSRSTVFRYEKGDIEKLPTEILEKLAKILNTTPGFLMGWETDETIDANLISIFNKLEPRRKKKVINYANNQLADQEKPKVTSLADYHRIEETHEIYLQSKVSAGTGILDLDSEYKEEITYTGKLPQYYDMAFAVAGDSMRPVFEDGEIIFVEKMDYPINGALMVVQIDEEAFVKKVYIEENDLRLVSLNKDYKDIYADSRNDIRIVGKVVM